MSHIFCRVLAFWQGCHKGPITLIFPRCCRWNCLLLMQSTHKITSLLQGWRTRLQVAKILMRTLSGVKCFFDIWSNLILRLNNFISVSTRWNNYSHGFIFFKVSNAHVHVYSRHLSSTFLRMLQSKGSTYLPLNFKHKIMNNKTIIELSITNILICKWLAVLSVSV